MKLKVLVDNNTFIDQYYFGEPAVSYYIEDEDTKILLDVGYSDVFLKNSIALGLDLEKLDTIVISHGHDDHTKGLKYFFEQYHNKDISIIAHPHAFKFKIKNDLVIGSPILEEDLKQISNLNLSREPVKISKNITFLGEIPQMNNFEARKPIGNQLIDDKLVDDYVMDDSALVYKSERGIYIITGCSHSGICNIVEYAKELTGDKRVLGIIGGFHLFDVTERVDKTIDYLKQYDLKELYPCHCTSFAVKAKIHSALPIKEVGVGLEISW